MRTSFFAPMRSATMLVIALAVVESGAMDRNGVVLAFSFEKTEGEVVRDESPAGNDGTLIDNAAIVNQGKFGRALMLDGGGDQVIVPKTDSLMIRGPMTVMAWVNFLDPIGRQTIIQKLEHFGNRGAGGWMLSMANGGNSIEWSISTDPKRMRNIFAVPVGGVGKNIWYQIAATWDEDTQRVYWDGDMVGDTPSLGNVQTPSGDPVKIGARDQAQGDFFVNGRIDEVLIAARVLTEDEMAEHRNMSLTQALSVDPAGKLAAVWASLKERR